MTIAPTLIDRITDTNGQLTIDGVATTLASSNAARIEHTATHVVIVERDGSESVWTPSLGGARLAVEDGRIVAV